MNVEANDEYAKFLKFWDMYQRGKISQVLVAQVSALNNSNPYPGDDPYADNFHPGWYGHPNPSYSTNLPPQYDLAQPPNPCPPFKLNPSDLSETNLESFMENFIMADMIENQAMKESIRQLSATIDSLSAQLTITYEGPITVNKEEKGEHMVDIEDMVVEEDKVVEEMIVEDQMIEKSVVIEEEDESPKKTDKTQATPKLCQPPSLLPQRPVDANLEQKNGKLLEVVNELEVNILP